MLDDSISLTNWTDTWSGVEATPTSGQREPMLTGADRCDGAAECTARRYIMPANDNAPGGRRVAVLVSEAKPERDEIEVMDALITSIDLLIANDNFAS